MQSNETTVVPAIVVSQPIATPVAAVPKPPASRFMKEQLEYVAKKRPFKVLEDHRSCVSKAARAKVKYGVRVVLTVRPPESTWLVVPDPDERDWELEDTEEEHIVMEFDKLSQLKINPAEIKIRLRAMQAKRKERLADTVEFYENVMATKRRLRATKKAKPEEQTNVDYSSDVVPGSDLEMESSDE